MTSKTEAKITRRQVDNLRGESMRQASYLMSRLRMSVLGKPAIETCECGKEYELFPNQPTKLDTAQVNAGKFEIDKIYPGITDEDFAKVTNEGMSIEEQAKFIGNVITSYGDMQQPTLKEIEQCRDLCNARLNDKVIPISTGNKEEAETRH